MHQVLSHEQRARVAAALFDAGVELMRNNLRRKFPQSPASDIDRMLKDWMHRKGDAVPGDVAGPVRVRPLHP